MPYQQGLFDGHRHIQRSLENQPETLFGSPRPFWGPLMGPHGEGTVGFDKAKNRYYARIPFGRLPSGKTKYLKRYGSSRADAQKIRRILLNQRDTGELSREPLQVPTFQSFALAHLDGEARNEIREISRRGYAYLLEKYVFPEFGAKKLNELNSQEISAFLVSLRTKVSASQTNHVRAAMSRIFQSALSHKLIADNPMRRTKRMRPKEGDRTLTQPPWTLVESKHALEVAVGTEFDLFIHLAVLTGARLGEMLGLRWGDIDLEAHTLTIRRTLVELRGSRNEGGVKGTPTFGPPKTAKSVRALTFGTQLHDAFLRHRAAQDAHRTDAANAWVETDCVFTTATGSAVWVSNFSARYRRFLKVNNLRHVNVHAHRHGAAQNAITLGVPLHAVSAMLGHSSLSTTMNVYLKEATHLQDEATRGLAKWYED